MLFNSIIAFDIKCTYIKIIKMNSFMISKISATSKYMFSKIFKTPQFYVKDIYFPFTIQAVSTETAAGTQKQNVYNFDISTVLVR